VLVSVSVPVPVPVGAGDRSCFVKKPRSRESGVQEEAPNRPSIRKERYSLTKDHWINQMRGTRSQLALNAQQQIFFHKPE
jgi:hypothetical protein